MMDARDRSVRRWLFSALVFAALFWSFDLAVLRAGVPDPLDDTWEYGVAARHLLDGAGFRTRVIHPPLLELINEQSSVPVLVHGPLLPVLCAPLVAATGGIDGVAWLAALFALAAAWLTFRIGARRYGP